MPPLLIRPVTPETPGFLALRSESLEQQFAMLRRLTENWQSGKNRFNAPREKLLGAFIVGQQQLVSVITHSGHWFDFLNTHAPSSAWPFYETLGFRPVYDEPRVTHRLFCSL
ncbi:GNAT family N-acetyltransferase [Klebsiella sp. R445]